MMKTLASYEIQHLYLAFVPPLPADGKKKRLRTKILTEENDTTEYLFKIFDAALDDAKIEIIFKGNDAQTNDVRSTLLSLVTCPEGDKNKHSLALCHMLYDCTDNRNGNGLFAIIEGKKASNTRLVLIRFKGVEGLVSGDEQSFISHMSEVFTKKSTAYKMAVYDEMVSDKAYWKGYSVDKQISSTAHKPISLFWISEFLKSETALTSAQGTMQFSKVIKEVLSKANGIVEQEQIISGLVNLKSKRNVQISLADFCTSYLTSEVAEKVKTSTSEAFYNAVFKVDNAIYSKEFGKTVLSMEDGITAYIPTFSYDKHVQETVNKDGSKNIIIEAKLQSKKLNVESKSK